MSRIEYLYERCMAAEADAAEQREFLQLLRLQENALVAKQLIARAYHAPKEVVDVNEESSKAILEAIFKASEINNNPVHRVHFLKTAWFKYAAAIILVITGIGIYYSFFHTPQSQTEVVRNTPPSVPGPDILPGGDRAILTLSNGQQVQLNNATSETINDGTLSIKNNQGRLSYKNTETAVVNTMTTPKGGQYKLTLADGTNVWLNAASSITYPTAFTGKTREVSVTGEAYFEVTKNKEKPFIVKASEVDVTVIGTSFNVNTYSSHPSKTTLVEGSIKLSTAKTSEIITPGQQAILENNQLTISNNINLKEILAWKNGTFYFDNQPLKSILDEFSRWYDVEIIYRGKITNRTFFGIVSRNKPLSHVLKLLEANDIKFQIDGRNLIVQGD